MHSAQPTYPKPDTGLARGMALWEEAAAKTADEALAGWMRCATDDTRARALMETVFSCSPFLSSLLLHNPSLLRDYLRESPDALCQKLLSNASPSPEYTQAELMKALRLAKGQMALAVALADIEGAWELQQVTGALSRLAEHSLTAALDFLLRQAAARKDITLADAGAPSRDSGIVVLGMGKLGAHELNYSSDIDLIILFESGRLHYAGRHNEQQFMNKLAYDLVHIMQERTADGYVFRTDLRLRPDPASTPPAINVEGAYYYYESVGQNWERAAMIKARPVAGDMEAGNAFLKNIAPFMWRRSLDFAAIQDIHSIKRQMDTHQGRKLYVRGHNVKLGIGGIREIEFYVQIHQLIWGGRMPVLRTRATCETLGKLREQELIDATKEKTLTDAYQYLRKLEHRLQMVADEQTHSLPAEDEELARIARFMGYGDTAQFMHDTQEKLSAVHDIFANAFQSSEKLGDEGNLVFTGASHDPDTLETLRNMGYSSPETVSEIVMGWHHGSKRATRTKRARELLTELMPTLLKRLSETANPDAAFLKFNDFLTNLPAGVQLFSLFNVNPQLLGLVADIMGSAPSLAEKLSKSPALLDAVLHSDFYHPLPEKTALEEQFNEVLAVHSDFETRLDALVRLRNEKQFRAGVHLLRQMTGAEDTGKFLSMMTEIMLGHTLSLVSGELKKNHGRINGGRFAIIALGKLGSCEMTFGSDIDLVFVYDSEEESTSDGEKQLGASAYYNRLAQRLLNTLTVMGREGRMYEVDTRLRPSGQGLLVSSLSGLHKYFEESAWTFEYMAFTKARAVAGDASLCGDITRFVDSILAKPKDEAKLKHDVKDMRERIEKEFPARTPWNIKYARGGMIDADFIAQYLLLLHAPAHGHPATGNTREIIRWLAERKAIASPMAETLLEATALLSHLFHMLRLCNNGDLDEASAPPGLKRLLSSTTRDSSFESLRARLIAVEQTVRDYYSELLN